MKKKLILSVFMVYIAYMLSACAPTDTMTMKPEMKKANPSDQINKLDNDLSNARKNQLNVLAPDAFSKAEKHLNNAKSGFDRGDELSGILDNVLSGQSALLTAEETAKVVRSALAETIEARNLARAAGAAELGKSYADTEEDFLDLTKSVERGNLRWANLNKKKTTEGFRELELRAIKENTIGEVAEIIQIAEKAGAKKIVPETFAAAQAKLKEADEFISRERYQTDRIHAKAQDALFEAQRLKQVMSLAEKVREMNPEQISLFIEDALFRVADKLTAPDMRTQPFDVQVDNILGSVGALQSDRQFMVEKTKDQQEEIERLTEQHEIETGNLSRQISALEGRSKEEQASKERLAAEKRAVEERLAAEREFNQLYNEVQNYFAIDEAEVYKQGYQLVIRLKNMRFPVGKAVIMPDNYGLLSKVQRAIRTFGEPDLIIEGHTDSTGSEAVNELLSQQRADAVSEYLVANRTLAPQKILAVGYGSQRPLASNETEEGRAVNRRIDVIIKPVMEEQEVSGSPR